MLTLNKKSLKPSERIEAVPRTIPASRDELLEVIDEKEVILVSIRVSGRQEREAANSAVWAEDGRKAVDGWRI